MHSHSCVFVILTWNSAAYVERCLQSVLALPFGRLQVLLHDNGSSDGTPQFVRERFEDDISSGRIVLRQSSTNLGTTTPRNSLIREVDPSTDFVCILDSDTRVNPDAFEAMCRHYEADTHHSIGVMGPLMRDESGALQLSGRALPTLASKLGKASPIGSVRQGAAAWERCDTPVVDDMQDVGYLLSACWFLPYATLGRVGLLDEHYLYAPEDVDWCARVHKAGLRVVYVQDAEIVHAYQRIGHKKLLSKANVWHVAGLLHYFRKHRYLVDSRAIWDPSAQATGPVAQATVTTTSDLPNKLLFYTEAWGRGGIETFVRNTIPGLREAGIHVDLCSTWDWGLGDDDLLREYDVRRFVHFPGRRPSQLRRLVEGPRSFREVLDGGTYDAVWINTMNGGGFLYAREAKRAGVPIRVVHSHNTDVGEGARQLKRLFGRAASSVLIHTATHLVACSREAGVYLFGEAPCTVVRNGIDADRFRFSPEGRHRVREELGIAPDAVLLGSIGRISPQKNPLFQVEVFAEYRRRFDQRAEYLMVGKPDMADEVRARARSLGVDDAVRVLGAVAGPAPYYSALDVMLVPSHYEGFGFALIEAQCAGLPVLSSDTLPPDADCTELSVHCGLGQSPLEWATTAHELIETFAGRRAADYAAQVANAGYSVEHCVDQVLQILGSAQIEAGGGAA